MQHPSLPLAGIALIALLALDACQPCKPAPRQAACTMSASVQTRFRPDSLA